MTPLDKLRAIEVDGNAGRCTHWLKAAAKEGANDIDRLQAALKPFADCARGDILNPSPDDWERAREVYEQITMQKD